MGAEEPRNTEEKMHSLQLRFTSVSDWRLNHFTMADPAPCVCSRAFSMHREKLCSMTFTSDPCPDLVMYFVRYSMTASLVSVGWKSVSVHKTILM